MKNTYNINTTSSMTIDEPKKLLTSKFKNKIIVTLLVGTLAFLAYSYWSSIIAGFNATLAFTSSVAIPALSTFFMSAVGLYTGIGIALLLVGISAYFVYKPYTQKDTTPENSDAAKPENSDAATPENSDAETHQIEGAATPENSVAETPQIEGAAKPEISESRLVLYTPKKGDYITPSTMNLDPITKDLLKNNIERPITQSKRPETTLIKWEPLDIFQSQTDIDPKSTTKTNIDPKSITQLVAFIFTANAIATVFDDLSQVKQIPVKADNFRIAAATTTPTKGNGNGNETGDNSKQHRI